MSDPMDTLLDLIAQALVEELAGFQSCPCQKLINEVPTMQEEVGGYWVEFGPIRIGRSGKEGLLSYQEASLITSSLSNNDLSGPCLVKTLKGLVDRHTEWSLLETTNGWHALKRRDDGVLETLVKGYLEPWSPDMEGWDRLTLSLLVDGYERKQAFMQQLAKTC